MKRDISLSRFQTSQTPQTSDLLTFRPLRLQTSDLSDHRPLSYFRPPRLHTSQTSDLSGLLDFRPLRYLRLQSSQRQTSDLKPLRLQPSRTDYVYEIK